MYRFIRNILQTLRVLGFMQAAERVASFLLDHSVNEEIHLAVTDFLIDEVSANCVVCHLSIRSDSDRFHTCCRQLVKVIAQLYTEPQTFDVQPEDAVRELLAAGSLYKRAYKRYGHITYDD